MTNVTYAKCNYGKYIQGKSIMEKFNWAINNLYWLSLIGIPICTQIKG